jgi:hypothetical protein
MQEARGSRMRWESAFGSRGAMSFVLALVALEVVILVGLILLPGLFSLESVIGFFLSGLAHLAYFFATVFFLIFGLWTFRSRKITALNPVFVLVTIGVILVALNLKAMTIRFWIFRDAYTNIATRVINQEFPIKRSDSPLMQVTTAPNVPLVSGRFGTIQWGQFDENSLVFFVHSGFLFRECGYMYSSENVMPDVSVFDFGNGAQGGFDPVAPNWFYGCIKYD